MPELPDVVVYVEAVKERVVGHRLTGATVRGPFLLRTVTPAVDALYGQTATEVRRAGKRIAILNGASSRTVTTFFNSPSAHAAGADCATASLPTSIATGRAAPRTVPPANPRPDHFRNCRLSMLVLH